jgi:hypothetical protein
MLCRVKLVGEESGRPRTIEMAIVCQRSVIDSFKSELAYAVGAGISIDPKKQVGVGADANGDFVLGRARQRRVNDVNMPDIHRTPYAANSAASWMI